MAMSLKKLGEMIKRSETNVRADMQEIKVEMRRISNVIEKVKQTAQEAKGKAQANEQKIETLTKRIAQMNDRQRRRNLRFTGIPEEISNKDLEGAMWNWFKEQGIQIKSEDIERAHRLFTPRRRAGAPREVIVAFAREKLRDEIYKLLRQKTDLHFNERKVIIRYDLSPETLQARRTMQQFAQALFKAEIRFTWAYPATLLVFKEGRKYSARNPEEARRMLRDLEVEIQEGSAQELLSLEEEEGGGEQHSQSSESSAQQMERKKRRKGLGGEGGSAE